MAQTGQESDESLMARVRRGDHGAFAILVRRHTNMFFAAAYRMSGHAQESEDIVQEAFLKLWDRPEAWDPNKGTKFTTWFYRVVTNLAIDKKRREKPSASPDILETMSDRTPGADVVLMQKEQDRFFESAIGALPERQKAALNLCFYEGLSNSEAAKILGISVKALESLLMRAKAGLKGEFLRKGLLTEEPYERKRSHV